MKEHKFNLTDEEDSILTIAAGINLKPVAEFVEKKGKDALIRQMTQYLEEGCIAKVKGMTVAEKISFLGS